MNTIRILLIEDEPAQVLRMKGLLDEAMAAIVHQLGVPVVHEVQVAPDFRAGLRELADGIYPVVIVDLSLPDPLAGANRDVTEYPGLAVISEAKARNKDAVVAAFTAYADETVIDLVERHVNVLFNKVAVNDSLRERCVNLLRLAMERFNFRMDVCVERAVQLAFRRVVDLGKAEQWELCLRRILSGARNSVVYSGTGSEPSGAGMVAAFVDDFLPSIFKLGRFSDLAEEAYGCERHVKPFIPLTATATSGDDVAQAGEVGILAYSLVGMEHHPATFGSMLRSEKTERIVAAIEDHFIRNCSRWFAAGGVERPYELGPWLRAQFNTSSTRLRDASRDARTQEAIGRAARELTVEPEHLVEAVCLSIEAAREMVFCKPPTYAHGDLNVNNLIWDGKSLWMIDFARTTDQAFRVTDFVKLEASVTYDVESFPRPTVSDKDQVHRMVTWHDPMLRDFHVDVDSLPNMTDGILANKAAAIHAIRQCAARQFATENPLEYWLGLFFVTAKHVEYLSADALEEKHVYVPLVAAWVAAFRLAKTLESNIAS